MGGRGVGFVALCLVTAAGVAAAPASAATFTNSAPITDPTYNVVGGYPHPLSPYASTISVSGQVGTISSVRVTLMRLGGGEEEELDVLLVGPGGSSMVVSDICSAGAFSYDFTGETWTFDDNAPAAIPDACTTRVASGTYRPTNYDTSDSFPGVPGPYPLGLAAFAGTSPNGVWSLYAVDDSYPDPVTIDGGWSLELTTATATPATPASKKKCKKKHKKRSASAAKKKCKKRR
jgi:hypothetical protein